MLKVEHYQLDLVGFPLGTASALDPDSWSWTLFISGVAQGVRHQLCVGILTCAHKGVHDTTASLLS